MLDYIKDTGYHYSTKSAVTISISDMEIPAAKAEIVSAAEDKVDQYEALYRRGLMSDKERYDSIISTWRKATEDTADALMENLGNMNNLYIMANSGARGNKSQISQIGGMRGLMANATGHTVEIPIKSNFREGLSILEYFISSNGARKGLTDTALRTADSGYLTRRLVDISHSIIIGQAESRERAAELCARMFTGDALARKHQRATQMTLQLTDPIAAKTGDPVFDMYSRQTYLDNLLRGGTPVTLPGGKVVYIYSRKHGDPERDYNAFRMRPEYYSQGNGNFRDVNQNRRCDVLFSPAVARSNVHMFYNLLQADGYNPLVVEYVQFTLPASAQQQLLPLVAEESREAAAKLLAGSFTPGQLRMALEDARDASHS